MAGKTDDIRKVFSQTCRICSDQNKTSLQNIFSEGNHIKDGIMGFAKVHIEENDLLPQGICLDCLGGLQLCFEFKEKCEKTDNKLRKLLGKFLKKRTSNSSKKLDKTKLHAKIRCSSNKSNGEDINDSIWDNTSCCSDTSKEVNCLNKEEMESILCDRCSQTFLSESQLKTHIRNKHKIAVQKKCETCNKTLPNVRAYNMHIKRHKGESSYVCEICGRSFLLLTTLKSHSLIHRGELPFQCPHCPHRARLPQSLAAHVRTHTGERPYSCPHCAATFTTSSNRAKHIRYHSDATPYRCDHCPKAYSRKKDQLDHISKVHLGVKRHQCDICTKRLASNSSLIYHRRVVHNVKRKYMGMGKVPDYLRQQDSKQASDLKSSVSCDDFVKPPVLPLEDS